MHMHMHIYIHTTLKPNMMIHINIMCIWIGELGT
jgi:hypothetical protein